MTVSLFNPAHLDWVEQRDGVVVGCRVYSTNPDLIVTSTVHYSEDHWWDHSVLHLFWSWHSWFRTIVTTQFADEIPFLTPERIKRWNKVWK